MIQAARNYKYLNYLQKEFLTFLITLDHIILIFILILQGYVVSIMGRKRPLANINAQDYKLRTQAERQAVNFVVQGKELLPYLPVNPPVSVSAWL